MKECSNKRAICSIRIGCCASNTLCNFAKSYSEGYTQDIIMKWANNYRCRFIFLNKMSPLDICYYRGVRQNCHHN